MEYRTLGKTGLKVSALSFGASSLGGVFKPVDESVAIRSKPQLSIWGSTTSTWRLSTA
jgi:predicted aldo/keto reductase-like oxidoreductase